MTKRLFLIVPLMVACGGSATGPGSVAKHLANFIGAPWNATVTTTATCPSQANSTDTSSFAIPLSTGTNADLQYTSQDGCLFQFVVATDTAQLSNAPVTCTTKTVPPATVTIQRYGLASEDGRHLTLVGSGTIASSGQTCTLSMVGTATR